MQMWRAGLGEEMSQTDGATGGGVGGWGGRGSAENYHRGDE